MAIEWEHKVREIVERAGFLPRPLLEEKHVDQHTEIAGTHMAG